MVTEVTSSNRLREWRTRTRHTQNELAHLMGSSITVVSRHENGRGIGHNAILAYARLFKIPTYALFYRPPHPAEIPSSRNVHNRIDELRVGMNLTLQELSRLTDIPTDELTGIARWEIDPTHQQIVALARVFKIPTYQLFLEPHGSHRDDAFEQDVYSSVDPSQITDDAGDLGTPYEEFSGGFDCLQMMEVAS